MRLSVFIEQNPDAVVTEWVSFAREQLPAAASMDEGALLDHGRHILLAIVADMRRPQDDAQRQARSQGKGDGLELNVAEAPSQSHARQRERAGFDIEQMVAEYRALRAAVLRLWTASTDAVQPEDLDDVARFNESIDQALSESLAVFVEEMNKTRDLFLGMLGHDLRGPLSTISNYANLAVQRRPDEAQGLAVVGRSVRQMKALLDDLVEYTRHRFGSRLPVTPVSLQLDAFARETLEEIEAWNSGHRIELEFTGDLSGEWDPKRLHQALSNLVFNALKYGSPKSTVRVRLDGTGTDQVTLAVVNVGPPVPPTVLPRLFDPLVRAEDPDEAGCSQLAGASLGLGLFVVREIATAHGGIVTVTSGDSETRFELRLPRYSAQTQC